MQRIITYRVEKCYFKHGIVPISINVELSLSLLKNLIICLTYLQSLPWKERWEELTLKKTSKSINFVWSHILYFIKKGLYSPLVPMFRLSKAMVVTLWCSEYSLNPFFHPFSSFLVLLHDIIFDLTCNNFPNLWGYIYIPSQ